jgi:hypothetical protein
VTYNATRLQDLEDLSVYVFALRGVDSGLDGVDSVEDVLAELRGHVGEVALLEGKLMTQAGLGRILDGSIDLEDVIVDPNDVGICERADLSGRTTDPTADIEYLHVLFDADLGRKVVLMSRDPLGKCLSFVVSRKMEILRRREEHSKS